MALEEEVFDQRDGIEASALDGIEDREIDFQGSRAEFGAVVWTGVNS